MSEFSSASRLRFAPSPTGYLHVGGARTALFNWLLARKYGGALVLRIEDTDRERSSEAMIEGVIAGLRWLGITWDEGPFLQSGFVERHRAVAYDLLDRGLAYRAFETPEQLEAMRAEAQARQQAYLYKGGIWRAATAAQIEAQLAAGTPYVVRLKTPVSGAFRWHDAVFGDLSGDWSEIEDYVLLRSDSNPTYMLSAVVDDIDMRITHVIRGADHINNTPKQILLYQALGAEPPHFGHLPLILGADRSRLSKRHGATSVLAYRDEGFLPWAFCNFLALIGWSTSDNQEIFATAQELIDRFSLDRISRTNGVFDVEKARWLNSQHLAHHIDLQSLKIALLPHLQALGIAEPLATSFDLSVTLLRSRARTLVELAQMLVPYVGDTFAFDEAALQKNILKSGAEQFLPALIEQIQALDFGDPGAMEAALREFCEAQGIGTGKVFNCIRTALTGQKVSPGIFETLQAIGKPRAIARLERALQLSEAARVASS
ncbi:glutamate--tRNA ligase [Gloeobacter kilaueensis]|uniref:Glutamate--tRNA ligase n=1 Tax=Gloeobacter kilaueensis (strain ATCC BAA-2537 / CCAP 1431/1 / ULC 316 / JS1) TaxID=1183438 RepID=U5QSF9_GLOK1|nr:glutamate--tRNA ligase [Gloeobacter kilaueensis]AGY60670.1 glutamate--tRNA ligase [Gloeobacter kilaueensis JS1]